MVGMLRIDLAGLTGNVSILQLLDFYDLRNKAKWVYVGYETVFIAVFFIFAWLALTFIRHQKR